jgi:hypothetical protein
MVDMGDCHADNTLAREDLPMDRRADGFSEIRLPPNVGRGSAMSVK